MATQLIVGGRALGRSSAVAAVLVLLGAGCYTPRSGGEGRALALWQEMAPGSRSEEAPPAPAAVEAGLTADEAVALALRASPALAALVAEAAAEEAVAEAEGQLPNPELRIGELRFDPLFRGETEVELGLRFKMARPGTLAAASDAARLEGAAKRAEERVAARELALAVRTLHAQIVLADEDLRAIDEELALREKRRALLQKHVEGGRATRLDLALTSLDQAEAGAQRAEVAADRAEAEAELRVLLGLPASTPLVLRFEDRDRRPYEGPLDEETLTKAALRARPELAAAAARVQSAEAEVFVQRAERYPWFSFAQLSYDFDPDSGRGTRGIVASLGLELPVFSWNTGGIGAAEATVTQREAEERAAVVAVAAEVQAAAARVRATAARLVTLETTLLPAAEESARAVEAALAAGAVDTLHVTFAEEHRVRARRSWLEALRDHREAVIALQAAVGDPI